MNLQEFSFKNIIKRFQFNKEESFEFEGVKISLGVIAFVLLLLFIIPFFFNNSTLKFQIEQKISQISGSTIAVNGKVQVSFLPSPTIILNDVVIRNYHPNNSKKESDKIYNIYARKAKLKLTIFKFIQDPVIRKIELIDPILEGYYAVNKNIYRNNKFSQIIDKLDGNKKELSKAKKSSLELSTKLFSIQGADESEFTTKNFPELVIKNGEIIFYNEFQEMRKINAINTNILISPKKISANGIFLSSDIVSNFSLNIKKNSKISIKISSPVLNFSINGNIAKNKEVVDILDSDFDGKLAMEIFELQSFYRAYINNNGLLAGKLKYNVSPIKISAEIINKAREVKISNIIINSDVISGDGLIEMDFSKDFLIADLKLDLDNLDLNKIWSKDPVTIVAKAPAKVENKDVKNEEINLLEKNINNYETSKIILSKEIKNINFSAEIKIKDIQYLSGEMKDADIYVTVSNDGKILILPITFKIPGQGFFRAIGVVDNKLGYPKFIGKIDIAGDSLGEVLKWLKIESQNLKFDNVKEYGIYSDLMLLPNKMNLNNFYLSLNQAGSELLGEISVNSIGKVPEVIGKFKINNLNIDDYFLTSGQNAYLSPGLLLRKMFWLNDISSNSNFKFDIDNLTYKGENFSNQILDLTFRRGYIKVSNLELQSEKTDLKANFLIDISSNNPVLAIDIRAKKFHYDTLEVRQDILEDSVLQNQGQDFFDRILSFPSLSGLQGRVYLDFENFLIDDFLLQNSRLTGDLKNGEIENAEISSDLYGGSFSYKGLLSIKDSKVINGNLSFNQVELKDVLSNFFGIENISGIANISANITTSADSKRNFKKNLSSEIKFNVNSPTIAKYGLNDLVYKMFAPNKYVEELKDPKKILLNSNSNTSFNSAKGSIIFNNKKEGSLRIEVSAPALNGILSGKVDLANNEIDALFNAIFLTGTRQKQIPINIAANLKGNINAIEQNVNLNQVLQYLGLKVEEPPLNDNQILESIENNEETGQANDNTKLLEENIPDFN